MGGAPCHQLGKLLHSCHTRYSQSQNTWEFLKRGLLSRACAPQLNTEAQAWSPVPSGGVQSLEQAEPAVGNQQSRLGGRGVLEADTAMLLEGRAAPHPPSRLVVRLGHSGQGPSPPLCFQLCVGVSQCQGGCGGQCFSVGPSCDHWRQCRALGGFYPEPLRPCPSQGKFSPRCPCPHIQATSGLHQTNTQS